MNEQQILELSFYAIGYITMLVSLKNLFGVPKMIRMTNIEHVEKLRPYVVAVVMQFVAAVMVLGIAMMH